jgi:hypothetical protein
LVVRLNTLLVSVVLDGFQIIAEKFPPGHQRERDGEALLVCASW